MKCGSGDRRPRRESVHADALAVLDEVQDSVRPRRELQPVAEGPETQPTAVVSHQVHPAHHLFRLRQRQRRDFHAFISPLARRRNLRLLGGKPQDNLGQAAVGLALLKQMLGDARAAQILGRRVAVDPVVRLVAHVFLKIHKVGHVEPNHGVVRVDELSVRRRQQAPRVAHHGARLVPKPTPVGAPRLLQRLPRRAPSNHDRSIRSSFFKARRRRG